MSNKNYAYGYYVPDCMQLEDADFIADSPDYVELDMGEHYWDHHDGWEDTWPVEFVIVDRMLNEISRFNVHMEAVPSFTAYPKEKKL